ncbi:hypothetical protein JO972_16670 [Verrucomicrobiaceae bacterium 5K15]|uniref:Uncharacterized protein n=1 Tax=Oceaniferula flava TaxID=2800421 RepID=A0AAE2SHD6_9BACT|nr:hypothetical protein [Oceaniferula flavus]MBK1856600.1 hypothetical protein [Oceaniferula flavus]MBM1137908.1 hypothetical protein [Oceaniferula flavus]
MSTLSVNQALDLGKAKNGECFEIEGILFFDFEDISLNHWPKSERRENRYESSIWIDAEGAFSFDEEVLQRWAGKRVVVLGRYEVSKASEVDGWDDGYGHMSQWPARIVARRIDLVKRRNSDHATEG